MSSKKIVVKALVVLVGLFLFSTSIVQAQPAPVRKTGQTTSYTTGDDGYYQKGVAWPNPRFTDNGDGTVTDNLTGLMWTKNADLFGERYLMEAITMCENLILGKGCGYTDWRVPNRFELESLLDLEKTDPALPTANPFTNVQKFIGWYWTSSWYEPEGGRYDAWAVWLPSGAVDIRCSDRAEPQCLAYVWPVRGGQ